MGLDNAIYVESGNSVQSRIDDAPMDGVVVFDPAITFNVASPISVTTPGLTIYNPHLKSDAEIDEVINISSNGVTVKGGHINGADLARRGIISTGNDTIIEEVSLENFSESDTGIAPCGIRLQNGKNATVRDCTVRAVSAPYTTIARGIVTSGINSSGILKIIGNTVEDVSPVDDADGIVIGGTWTRAVVAHNTVEDCHKRSFKVQPQAPGLTIVSDNSCYYSLTAPDPFSAIEIQQDNVVVADNIVDYETCNTALIQLQGDNLTVTGNNLTVRNPSAGLDGVNTTTEQHGVTVANNTIEGVSRDGVRFRDGTTNSTVMGNVIRSPGRYGVMVNNRVINPDSVTVANNVIDGSDDHGIILYSATNSSVTGNSGSAAGDFINLFGGDVEIGHNPGYITHSSGNYTTSGDGTKVYTLPHNVEKTPSSITVTPTSADAMGNFYISNRTYSDFKITYETAPPSGTGNLSWEYNVKEEL